MTTEESGSSGMGTHPGVKRGEEVVISDVVCVQGSGSSGGHGHTSGIEEGSSSSGK